MDDKKYGKIEGHHCWWLTVNGKSLANFDRESDVDAIIKQQTESNELKAMVNALRDAARLYHEGYKSSELEEANSIMIMSPAQCLANVKADAVDEFSMHIGLTGKALSNYVNKLRKTMITTSSESSLSEVVNKINEEL